MICVSTAVLIMFIWLGSCLSSVCEQMIDVVLSEGDPSDCPVGVKTRNG